MPCYTPIAVFMQDDGEKKRVSFSSYLADCFKRGVDPCFLKPSFLPCGSCIGCRLERSRQWAVRMMHEAQMHESNCFLTLTFDDDHLESMCRTELGLYTVRRKHMQDFMKRVRAKHSVRYYYSGEYGDRYTRPHYHVCLFGYDFKADRQLWKRIKGSLYYVSDELCKFWSFGHSVISDLTFDSAAYVARYCMKKLTGKLSDVYMDREPEFGQGSLKPGLGASWVQKFASTDVYPHDSVVVRGVECKPPRYYDKILQRSCPLRYDEVKLARQRRAELVQSDHTFRRLQDRMICTELKMRHLVRVIEKQY